MSGFADELCEEAFVVRFSEGFRRFRDLLYLRPSERVSAVRSPYSTVFGHRMLLFDLGGAIAAVCMFATAIVLTVRHTAQLYREEPLA